jgi:hypothetical protein
MDLRRSALAAWLAFGCAAGTTIGARTASQSSASTVEVGVLDGAAFRIEIPTA